MEIDELLQARKEVLSFYSHYPFLREFTPEEQFQLFVEPKITALLAAPGSTRKSFMVEGTAFVFLYEYLSWDSSFFDRSCYRVFTVLYPPCEASSLIQAIRLFREFLSGEKTYCFIELPSEDIFLMQCLTTAGLKLVETRSHYYKQDLSNFSGERFPIRAATTLDVEAIAQLAAEQRNLFDRTHADTTFTLQEADAYLAKYAQEALNGFCTGVLVPQESSSPTAFLAFTNYQESLPTKMLNRYHVALAVVGPSYKGGLFKLLSELLYLAKEKQADTVTYTTQTTNKAAIRTCEKLGFSYARATHILSFSS